MIGIAPPPAVQPENDPWVAPPSLRRFVDVLIGRYARWRPVAEGGSGEPAELAGPRISLELAEAAMRLAGPGARPPQVAVVGPTQTGKSTVVNLLLGQSVAEVSPLAGFTVHAHGFASGTDVDRADWIADLFPGWQRVQNESAARDDLAAYCLTGVERVDELPPCCVWDTPDFDSLAAHTYRRGVLEASALADVLVIVLSKEKYADRSVWRFVRLIRPLGRSLVFVLNKLTDDSESIIVSSLRERIRESWPGVSPPIVPFRHAAAPGDLAPGPLVDAVRAAMDALARRTPAQAARARAAGVAALVREHWPAWTAPILAEQRVIEAWDEGVRRSIADALAAYRRDYLDHAQRYDAFRRATVALLDLLELPVVGGTLGRVRQVATWPLRRIWTAGTAFVRKQRGAAHARGAEEVVTDEILDWLRTSLERDVRRRGDAADPEGAYWMALAAHLAAEGAALRERWRAAGAAARERFAPRIQAAASKLHDALRQRPALLNSLRAARATGDAASILLALKTGGMHLNDIVLAPAMFAVMSLLTEGALGSYMRTVADDLKRQQLAHMQTDLLESPVASDLHALARTMRDERLFGVAPADAQAADAARAEWEARCRD